MRRGLVVAVAVLATAGACSDAPDRRFGPPPASDGAASSTSRGDSSPDLQPVSAAQDQSGLFRPEDLGLLEGPDRAAWQKPDLIMDALNIAEGATVADIGAGGGWFTIRLAQRVGPNGVVYTEDVQDEMLESIRRRVRREGLENVITRRGTSSDPNIPSGSLDAALLVDTYQEVGEGERVVFLRNLAKGLKPNGRIGIVNYKPGRGGPGPEPDVRMDRSVVEQAARDASLRVLDFHDLPYQYLLVLGK